MSFDLLSTIEYGGCSAKLSPKELEKILNKLPKVEDKNLLVDIETHDDAGVYKINNETALIFTTDFFPPVCSDPYTFGQIAAANALSDVYAMGGTPLLSLNLMMFSTKELPDEAFSDILLGGQNKINEANALTVGGHTIEDHPPKYGLAVVGTVHPDNLITNSFAKPGDKLILTKPIGIGALIAGQREGMTNPEAYNQAIEQMKLLNKVGAEIMRKYNVKAATDITGFGLLGHAMKLAKASEVCIKINSTEIPLLDQAYELFDDGCIPGAAFRNLEFVAPDIYFAPDVDYNIKMLANDAQTSGGLLICAPAEHADAILSDLLNSGVHPNAKCIGEVAEQNEFSVMFE